MKTSEIAIVFIMGTLTLLAFVFFVILMVIEYRRRQALHLTDKLNLQHEYERQMLHARIEVEEQTSRHFSEELHDNIAQVLSLVKLRLYKTAGRMTDEVQKKGIDESCDLLSKALNDLRNLSHLLSGDLVASLPLAESLEKELGYVHDTSEVETELEMTGIPAEVSPDKKLLAFRIVQEALNNALKHGKPTHIGVRMAFSTGQVRLQVCDNGRGFDTATIAQGKGLGLRNMQQRAKMVGTLHIASEVGKGTTVTLTITL